MKNKMKNYSGIKKRVKNNSLVLKVNTKIYSPEALYKTCYVFIDQAYLFLDGDPEREIIVVVKGKKKLKKLDLEKLAGEFMNELLSNSLRMNLSKKTLKIREQIISQALFSAISGQDGAEDDADGGAENSSENDPLGIAVPWEEKYGKKSS